MALIILTLKLVFTLVVPIIASYCIILGVFTLLHSSKKYAKKYITKMCDIDTWLNKDNKENKDKPTQEVVQVVKLDDLLKPEQGNE